MKNISVINLFQTLDFINLLMSLVKLIYHLYNELD